MCVAKHNNVDNSNTIHNKITLFVSKARAWILIGIKVYKMIIDIHDALVLVGYIIDRFIYLYKVLSKKT